MKKILILSALILAATIFSLVLIHVESTRSRALAQDDSLLKVIENAALPSLISGDTSQLESRLKTLLSNSSVRQVSFVSSNETLVSAMTFDLPAAPDEAVETHTKTLMFNGESIATLSVTRSASSSSSIYLLLPLHVGLLIFVALSTWMTLNRQWSKLSGDTSKLPAQPSSNKQITPAGGHIVLIVSLRDLKNWQLASGSQTSDHYMSRLNTLINSLADPYSLRLISTQEDSLVFVSTITNRDQATKKAVVFGWCLNQTISRETGAPQFAALVGLMSHPVATPLSLLHTSQREELRAFYALLIELGQEPLVVDGRIPLSALTGIGSAEMLDTGDYRVVELEQKTVGLWSLQQQKHLDQSQRSAPASDQPTM